MNLKRVIIAVFKFICGAFRNNAETSHVAINRNEASEPDHYYHDLGLKHKVSQSIARKLIGANNIFGIGDAIKYFGVKPTFEQLMALSEVPFSEETIVSCKKTHLLVAVFPMSILDMGRLVGGNEPYPFLLSDEWYREYKSFSNFCGGEARWHLIRKTPVEGSVGMSLSGQQHLIDENSETPEAHVMVYATIGHYKKTGVRLFEHVSVVTSSLDVASCRVCVGKFSVHSLNGLRIVHVLNTHPSSSVGLASERKPFNVVFS